MVVAQLVLLRFNKNEEVFSPPYFLCFAIYKDNKFLSKSEFEEIFRKPLITLE